jgi:hypothetical protein
MGLGYWEFENGKRCFLITHFPFPISYFLMAIGSGWKNVWVARVVPCSPFAATNQRQTTVNGKTLNALQEITTSMH